MDLKTWTIFLISFFGWGLAGFISKLATNKIGEKSVFWDIIGYFPAVLIYSLIVFKTKELFSGDKLGIFFGILSGFIGVFGLIGFYILLSKKEASIAVPLTALYPVLTSILAFIFLKESLTLTKIIGIILAMIAIYLLNI